ncbi:MAG TPA: hypothetical protein VN345_00475 [Blastocatellia bacterium]|jgi:hypothetical protein|nr:hypothetical protein [Blastocatellia bacterium]
MRRVVTSLILMTTVLAATPLSLARSMSDDKTKDKTEQKTKGKERVYNAGFDVVWPACVRAANENFVLEHTEKESGVLSFHTGMSLTSNGFFVGVSVIKLDETHTKVVLNPQKKRQLVAWGAGGRIADKYFKGVEKNLAESPEDKPKPANDHA